MRFRVVVKGDFKQLPGGAMSSEEFKAIHGRTMGLLEHRVFINEMKPFKAANIQHLVWDLRVLLCLAKDGSARVKRAAV